MIMFMWFKRYLFHSSKREIVTTSCTMGKGLSAFSRCVGTILGSWVKRLIVPDLHCPPQTRECCSTRMTLININLLLVNCTRILWPFVSHFLLAVLLPSFECLPCANIQTNSVLLTLQTSLSTRTMRLFMGEMSKIITMETWNNSC